MATRLLSLLDCRCRGVLLRTLRCRCCGQAERLKRQPQVRGRVHRSSPRFGRIPNTACQLSFSLAAMGAVRVAAGSSAGSPSCDSGSDDWNWPGSPPKCDRLARPGATGVQIVPEAQRFPASRAGGEAQPHFGLPPLAELPSDEQAATTMAAAIARSKLSGANSRASTRSPGPEQMVSLAGLLRREGPPPGALGAWRHATCRDDELCFAICSVWPRFYWPVPARELRLGVSARPVPRRMRPNLILARRLWILPRPPRPAAAQEPSAAQAVSLAWLLPTHSRPSSGARRLPAPAPPCPGPVRRTEMRVVAELRLALWGRWPGAHDARQPGPLLSADLPLPHLAGGARLAGARLAMTPTLALRTSSATWLACAWRTWRERATAFLLCEHWPRTRALVPLLPRAVLAGDSACPRGQLLHLLYCALSGVPSLASAGVGAPL